MVRFLVSVFVLVLSSSTAFADALLPTDFAYGSTISSVSPSNSPSPLFSLTLGREIYQHAHFADLRDLRVFDATGAQVPFELSQPSFQSAQKQSRIKLPFFPIDGTVVSGHSGSEVVIKEGKDGTILTVRYAGKNNSQKRTSASSYLVDLRGIKEPLRALEFSWNSNLKDSLIRVVIEASADLRQWYGVVNNGALIKTSYEGAELVENSVPLPAVHNKFLRVSIPSSEPVEIREILGLSEQDEIQPPTMSFVSVAGIADEKEPGVFNFVSPGYFPVRSIRLALPQGNLAVQYQLYTRTDSTTPWSFVGSQKAYRILVGGHELISPPHALAPSRNRQWQVRVKGKDIHFAQNAFSIELGYLPETLSFLGSGAEPYQLAFGSAHVAAPDFGFSSLRATIPGGSSIQAVAAQHGAVVGLGSKENLAPGAFVSAISTKKIALWIVLLLVVGVVALMAFRLVKEMNGK